MSSKLGRISPRERAFVPRMQRSVIPAMRSIVRYGALLIRDP